MDRNENLARHIMHKTASDRRNFYLEGYLKGYMHKEADVNWGELWNNIEAGAGKLVPKDNEEWVQAAGGAGLGGLAGGMLGGWKGALGGALAGGAGAGWAARGGYKMPGLKELADELSGLLPKKQPGTLANRLARKDTEAFVPSGEEGTQKNTDEKVLNATNPDLALMLARLRVQPAGK
jgi:hypothetical protein